MCYRSWDGLAYVVQRRGKATAGESLAFLRRPPRRVERVFTRKSFPGTEPVLADPQIILRQTNRQCAANLVSSTELFLLTPDLTKTLETGI